MSRFAHIANHNVKERVMIKLGKVSEQTRGCGMEGLEFWTVPGRYNCQ